MRNPSDADPSFVIRKAMAADSEGILNCLRSAFEPFKARYTPSAYADTVLDQRTLEQRLQEMIILVAVSSSAQIVGTIACKNVGHQEGHFRGMAVLPIWQGRGVGQQLLDHAESEVSRSGCKRITLDTTEPLKRAMRFYERNGFRATERVTDFFGMSLFEYEKRL